MVLRGQKVIELPFGVDQNIGWLEISMDDAVLMKITQPCTVCIKTTVVIPNITQIKETPTT